MIRVHLLRGVSAAALTFTLGAASAIAQQALPTIDVGGARARPKPVVTHAPASAPAHVSAPVHVHVPAPVHIHTPAPVHIAAPVRVRAPTPVFRPAPPPITPTIVAAPAPDRYAEPKPAPFSRTLPANIPAVVESRTRQDIDKTTNVVTSADAFRYLPSIHVRERFIGDRNAIVSGRTTGTIQGAMTLVYADNVLLSNLLGNSFANAPRWAMVSPAEISRIDVIYGPFSALYPGNSIGGVLTMTTRMPDNFEVHASGNAAVQPFSLYSRNELNLGGVMNILVGDRINDLRYWVGYERLDNQGQAQTFPGNILFPTTAATPGARFFGGHNDFNQEGRPRVITGSAGADHVQSHMAKFKLSYDLAPQVRAKYQVGFWSLNNDTTVQSFINDRNGVPIYNTMSGRVALGPFSVTPGAVNPGHGAASHLMQAFELRRDTGGEFDFDFSATSYNFLRDFTNNALSYGLRPNNAANRYNVDPRGLNTNQGGTFWRTGDMRFIWRPEYNLFGKHEVSFGAHADLYSLATTVTNTAVWPSNFFAAIQQVNTGKTETKGVYVQDVWKFLPDWKLTLGGRGEFWRAFDGFNNAGGFDIRPFATSTQATGALTINPLPANPTSYPESHKTAFSPKASLEYKVTPDFTMRGSYARAYRFPTVSELFFFTATTASVNVNNPNLQTEICHCYDLTGDYRWVDAFGGAVGLFNPRISLFLDERQNAIVNQRTIDALGRQATINSNIDRARFRGVEVAAVAKDIFTPGLDFQGGVTFTDSKIISNLSSRDYVGNPGAFPAGNLADTVPAVLYAGRQFPRVPRIRIRAVGSYSPNQDMSFALGVRYSSGAFTTLANTDFNHNNYGNVDSEILVFDVKARYKVAPNWTLSAGVNNLGRWKAFVNPNPYPQRTFFFGLNYDLGGPGSGGASVAGLGGGAAAGAPAYR